jgi:hypothetical protein
MNGGQSLSWRILTSPHSAIVRPGVGCVMSLAVAYWILMLIFLVFGFWSSWPNLRAGGPNIVLFLILVIAGWKLFGPPINS